MSLLEQLLGSFCHCALHLADEEIVNYTGMQIQHFSPALNQSKLVSLDLKITHLPRAGLQHLANMSYRARPVAMTFSVDAM